MKLLSPVLLAAVISASSFGSAAQQSPGTMSSTVTAPVPIYTPNPPYSEEARKAGVSGVVEVDIMIDAAGNVQDARVVKPLGHGLDEKALETIRTRRFKPAMHNGVPLGGSMTIQVHFQFSASPSQPAAQPPPSATPGGEIHEAAGAGDLAKVKALLKDNPNLVFSKDNNDETPLHWAASRGHKNVAELLLANKAGVDARDNHGQTPLHAAAIGGHKDLAELLLASKAEVNGKDNAGDTPLHLAAFYGHKGVAELLLANHAEVNTKDSWGDTPLYAAMVTGQKDVAELLLAHKAEVDARDKRGLTPLFVAAANGRKDVAELLLVSKAEVNAKTDDGRTPLYAAAMGGHKDVAELLLANKAEVNAKDNGGVSPLQAAVLKGHEDVAKLLRQHGGQDAPTPVQPAPVPSQRDSFDPERAKDFYNRGNAYSAKGQYDRAIQEFDQAISLNPKSADAFYDRGNAYSAKGQYDRAIQDYDQAISLYPIHGSAFINRGDAYYAKGQYDRAIQDYDHAISLNPKFTNAVNGRGFADFSAGRFAAAARDFEQGLAIGDAQPRGVVPYIVLWLHLARARDGQADAEEFKRNAATLDLRAWPGPLVASYFRKMTAQEVMEAPKSGDEKMQRERGCEASFYLGEDAVLRHSTAEALRLLRQADEACPVSFVEHGAAAAELKRLGE